MITLWHNPRCSKSREALRLLQDAGAQVTLRNYLEDPPSLAEIETALTALNLAPIALIRKGETRFSELGLRADSDAATLKQAMADHPILIERPIAFSTTSAVIGRPPEAVMALL